MSLLTSFVLCLFGILISNSFFAAGRRNCVKGWVQRDRECYLYSQYPMTWTEALVNCWSYGRWAHLVSIHSKEEAIWLSTFIASKSKGDKQVWIGLRDFRRNGNWQWADGSAYNFNAWMMFKPDNYKKNEYCAQITTSSNFLEWDDAWCEDLHDFVCEYELLIKPPLI